MNNNILDKQVGNLWWKELESSQEGSKPVSGAGPDPASGPPPPSPNQNMSNLKVIFFILSQKHCFTLTPHIFCPYIIHKVCVCVFSFGVL